MSLVEYIQSLAKEVGRLLVSLKANSTLRKTKRIHIKRHIKELEYKNGRIVRCVELFFPIIKEEWDWKYLSDVINKIRSSSLYEKTYKKISEEYSISEQQADVYLSKFVHECMKCFLNNNPDKVIEVIFTFLNDLEEGSREWKVKAFIKGIGLEAEKIKISKNALLRKPTPSDFEEETPLDVPIFNKLTVFPSTILEINLRTKKKALLSIELEKLVIALRLYKLCSLFVLETIWQPKSILLPTQIYKTHFNAHLTYTYTIERSEETRLSKFVNKISSLLPLDENGKLLFSDPCSIAILRYQDALLKSENIENKIAYGIMGLEALYLKPEERGELSHKLAQRVAKTLGFLNDQPIKLYNILKRGYEIRSSFVHGSCLISEKEEKLNSLLENILECLRKSIITFLQLKSHKEKGEIINLIDKSMLDDEISVKLKKLLERLTIY